MSRKTLPASTTSGTDRSTFSVPLRPPDPLPTRRVDLVWTDEVTGERLAIEIVASSDLIDSLQREGFEEVGASCQENEADTPDPLGSDETAAA